MASSGEATAPPLVGDYMHDGLRLVEVLGIDREGNYECENCGNDCEIVKVPVQEIASWQVIVRE